MIYIEDLLKQRLNKLNSMELDIKKLNSKVDNNHKEVIGKLNILENKFDDLGLKNDTGYTEIVDKIGTLSKDVKFVKHKLHETEEDVFDIKDHLKIIK